MKSGHCGHKASRFGSKQIAPSRLVAWDFILYPKETKSLKLWLWICEYILWSCWCVWCSFLCKRSFKTLHWCGNYSCQLRNSFFLSAIPILFVPRWSIGGKPQMWWKQLQKGTLDKGGRSSHGITFDFDQRNPDDDTSGVARPALDFNTIFRSL